MTGRVLVVGDVNPDLLLSGMRTLPRLGQEILSSNFQLTMGGASANTAVGLARLGAEVSFVGVVGDDEMGHFVLRELAAHAVDSQHVVVAPQTTTGLTISLSYPQDRAFITHLGSNGALCLDHLDLSLLPAFDHLHVSSYFLLESLQADLPRVFAAARQAGLSISLDTGWDARGHWGDGLLELLPRVDCFLPNALEALYISRCDAVEAALEALQRHCRLVVIKRGAEGVLAGDGETTLSAPAYPIEPVDTTGAGDSFNAGFIFAFFLQNQALAEAMRLGAACGALATQGYGAIASQPTLDQALALVGQYPSG
ncbi:MAG: carbohydrate kinase family protein [Anaerolineae bacterium]